MTEMTPTAVALGLDEAPQPRPTTRRWLVWGILGGLLGFVATIVLDTRPWTEEDYASGERILAAGAEDMPDLDPLTNQLGFVLGFAAVACLLVFQAAWRTRVEQVRPGSIAAKVVSGGVTAAAAGLTFGYAWKGSLALYGHGGAEFGSFGDEGLLIFYALTDFGAFIPWFGVLVAFAGFGWLAWAERAISRIAGTLAGAAAALVSVGYVLTGVPGLAGPVSGLTLAVLCSWLLLGRRGIVAETH